MRLLKLSKKLWLTVAVILVSVIIAIVLLKSRQSTDVSESTQPASGSEKNSTSSLDVVFPVEVAIAHRGDLVKQLITTGVIRANREVEIVARTAGEIVHVGAQNGESVKLGGVLVKLDDREYRLAYERASAGLLSAQIEYRTLSTSPFIENADSTALMRKKEETKAKLRSAELQFKQGAINEENYARLKRDYETELAVYNAQRSDVVATKSGLSQATETYERSKLDLESTEIKAPFSGFAADCDLAIGKRVAPEQVLLKLVDVSRLLVDVEVLESEVSHLRVERKAEVAVNANPTNRLPGRILRINPIVDAKSKTVKVTVELKQSALHQFTIRQETMLRPGMFATVKLETDILPNRLLVPKEALLIRDQRALVFVAQSGLAKWQYVDVGEENDQFIEVKSGVSVGDTVIVNGHYTLAHDARITIQK